MKLKFKGTRKLFIHGMKFTPGEEYEENRKEVLKELLLSTMFEEIKPNKKQKGGD